MSYPATTPEQVRSARRNNALSLLFFILTAAAFALRFCIPPDAMNLVVNYTSETGGALYEKLHFGTYAIFALLPIVLFSRPIFLRGDEIAKFRDLLRYSGLLVLLIVIMIGSGRSGSSGFFIDTYLVAGVAGLVMLALNAETRRRLGDTVLAINMLSAVIGVFEVTTRMRIMPYFANEEAVFRPTGLADHPLTLGLTCAASIAFVALTRWPTWCKLLAMLVLFIGTAAAGARAALLLAGLEVFALLLFVPWGMPPAAEKKAKFVALLLTLMAGAVMISVLAAGGFLTRFEGGVVDENFYARTDIYKVFSYVGWKEILFGANLGDILKIVNEKLNLPFIESTPVYLTFQLGAILAVLFAILVFWLYWRLLRHQPRPAWIGIAVYLAAALSNNTLSTKTPVVAIFVVLLVAYLEPVPKAIRR